MATRKTSTKKADGIKSDGTVREDVPSGGPPSESEVKANEKAYHEAFPKSKAQEAKNALTPVGVAPDANPTDAELKKADSNLPVFDPRKELPPNEPMPDTPSGAALMEVGNLNGEDVDPAHLHDANVHGEAYQAAKRKRRWGY